MSQPFTTNVPVEDDVPVEWREDRLPTIFAGGNDYNEELMTDVTARVIEAAAVKPGDTVLDVGCGAGMPTLELAKRIGPSGRVYATDPSPVFVKAVTENARQRGLTNVIPQQASVLGLDYPPESFDAVTAQFSSMFFTDLTGGFSKIRTLLKPGARASFAAWGPRAENSMFGAIFGAASPFLPAAPPPDPTVKPFDFPNPMRFSEPGSISAVMREAGFTDIREDATRFDLTYSGGSERMIQFWLDITETRHKIAPDKLEELKEAVLNTYANMRHGDRYVFPVTVVIASGQA